MADRDTLTSGAYAFLGPIVLLAAHKRAKTNVAPAILGATALAMVIVNGRIFAEREPTRSSESA